VTALEKKALFFEDLKRMKKDLKSEIFTCQIKIKFAPLQPANEETRKAGIVH
jgi:hypothetical protein